MLNCSKKKKKLKKQIRKQITPFENIPDSLQIDTPFEMLGIAPICTKIVHSIADIRRFRDMF